LVVIGEMESPSHRLPLELPVYRSPHFRQDYENAMADFPVGNATVELQLLKTPITERII